MHIDAATVNSEKYAVYSDSEYIEFPRKEFDILFRLLSYPGRIFSKEQLMEGIWGYDSPTVMIRQTTHKQDAQQAQRHQRVQHHHNQGLGYRPRKMDTTIADTIAWLKAEA